MKSSASSGFTLVEIAVVLTIISVLMGSGILALNGALDDYRIETTKKRMNDIAMALAVYAQQNYFLPCPADPGIMPATGIPKNNCYGLGNSGGIVPFAELGLTQRQVMDAYGDYITYAVSREFATEARVQATGNSIHDACRINNVWFKSGANINPRKAFFCCSAANSNHDIVITDGSGNPVAPAVPRDSGGGVSGPINSGVATASSFNTQAVAVVLVSHGKNMYGAYTPNNANRISGTATGRADEVENANNDENFVYRPISTNATDYFDDIVLWRTQDQLISAFGRDSCAKP